MVGGLWLCLMCGRWRWSGIALVLWWVARHPLETAAEYINLRYWRLFAVRLPDGQLEESQTSRNKFAESKWLQEDLQGNLIHWS